MGNFNGRLRQARSGNKGFVLFVVIGIASVLGIMFLMIHLRSRESYLKAHRLLNTETARTAAESFLELFVMGFRNAVSQPPPKDDHLSAVRNGDVFAAGFFHFFLRDHGDENRGTLEHSTVMELLPEPDRNTIEAYAQNSGIKDYELKLTWVCRRELGQEHFQDPLSSVCTLDFYASAQFSGSVRSIQRTKVLRSYPLTIPLASRYSLFLSGGVSGYQRLITDLHGRPVLRDGDFKYPYNFPLRVFHSPLDSETDLKIYGDKPSTYEGLDRLLDASLVEKTKEAITGERGWLYLGPGLQTLRLTPGVDAFGQFFMIYNPLFLSLLGDLGVPRQVPLVRDERELSGYLANPMELGYGYLDVDFPGPPNGSGQASLQYVLDGHYESSMGMEQYIPDYRAESSLIQPFGDPQNPSRTYTSGQVLMQIAKLGMIHIDRDASDSDERNQEQCMGQVPPIRDNLEIIRNLTEGEFQNPNPLLMQPLRSQWENLNRGSSCGEPDWMVTPPDFNWNTLFPDYEDYKGAMSKIIEFPLNHLIDFPHYTHRKIPPHQSPDFKGYSFQPAAGPDQTFVFGPDEMQLPVSSLFAKDQKQVFYFQGEVDQVDVAQISTKRAYFFYRNQDKLEEAQVLSRSGQFAILDTFSRTIGVYGDLRITADSVIARGHISLVVEGTCFLPPIESDDKVVSIFCRNIVLTPPDKPGAVHRYEAQLFTTGTVSKANSSHMIEIHGSLGAERLDMNMFQASTAVMYKPELNPVRTEHFLDYRLALDDHNLAEVYSP